VIDEGISMQHRWNDDEYGQNRIIPRNTFLRATYPPDIPYITSLIQNRGSLFTGGQLTAFGTARHDPEQLLKSFIVVIIIIINNNNNEIACTFQFFEACNTVHVKASWHFTFTSTYIHISSIHQSTTDCIEYGTNP
jgi:hypothetical protein